jgi:acyl-CoA thioesterase
VPETRFDRDTAVTRLEEDVFEARVDRGWWVVAGPNGGYVAALLLRALTERVGEPDRTPRSLTLHYTRPPVEGPARIETRLERRGRSLSTLTARMLQDGRLQALAVAAFSKPFDAAGYADRPMPEVPPPERCRGIDPRIPIHDRYEYGWAIGEPPFSRPEAHPPQSLCGGWIRLREPRPLDAPLVAAYSDAFPPAIFSRVGPEGMEGFTGAVPTVDLTIHFRALPDSPAHAWTLAVFRSGFAREGFLEEDGEIWSADGTLVAQSRQLAIVR